jgi:hypothetical protein
MLSCCVGASHPTRAFACMGPAHQRLQLLTALGQIFILQTLLMNDALLKSVPLRRLPEQQSAIGSLLLWSVSIPARGSASAVLGWPAGKQQTMCMILCRAATLVHSSCWDVLVCRNQALLW